VPPLTCYGLTCTVTWGVGDVSEEERSTDQGTVLDWMLATMNGKMSQKRISYSLSEPRLVPWACRIRRGSVNAATFGTSMLLGGFIM
jgi:hypothetical protein